MIDEAAAGVFRLGDRDVSWWVVADDSGITVVDGGLPAQIAQLDALLRHLGRGRSDIVGGVLTHGHIDHVSCLSILQRQHGIPVHVPAADVGLATSKGSLDRKVLANTWFRPSALRTSVSYARQGVLRALPLPDPAPLHGDGVRLDQLPGSPRYLRAPGHTAGSAIFSLDDRGVVFSGDVLVTWDPFTARSGPRTLPAFDNADHEAALRALDRVADTGAEHILPGHGLAWHGPAAEAAAIARAA